MALGIVGSYGEIEFKLFTNVDEIHSNHWPMAQHGRWRLYRGGRFVWNDEDTKDNNWREIIVDAVNKKVRGEIIS